MSAELVATSREVAYVVVEVSDRPALGSFLTGIIGLPTAQRTAPSFNTIVGVMDDSGVLRGATEFASLPPRP